MPRTASTCPATTRSSWAHTSRCSRRQSRRGGGLASPSAGGARDGVGAAFNEDGFARRRPRALARVEGHHTDGKPTVLFLCVHNADRSQMALGFFSHLAGDRAAAWSGGSEPGHEINPSAIAAMAERGIDISGEFPKPWTDEIVRAADVVITMGCGDA